MGAEQSQAAGSFAPRKVTTETANFDFRGDGRGLVEEVEEEGKDCFSWQQQQDKGWRDEVGGGLANVKFTSS